MSNQQKLKIFLEGVSYQLIKLAIQYKNIFDKNGEYTGDIFEELADQFISYYILLNNTQIKYQVISKLIDQTVEYALKKLMQLSAVSDPTYNIRLKPDFLKGFIYILHHISPAKKIDASQLQPVWYAAGLADEILKNKILRLSQ